MLEHVDTILTGLTLVIAATYWADARGMLSAPPARRICASRASRRAHPRTSSKCASAPRCGTRPPRMPASASALSPDRGLAPRLHPMGLAGAAAAPARRKSCQSRHLRSRPRCCCQTPPSRAMSGCSGGRALERPSPMTSWCSAVSAQRYIQPSSPSATHLLRNWPGACLMPGSTICTCGAQGAHIMPQPT